MNKWKKVGLTALSASLVSASAYAGELAVTGGASITFHSDQDSTGNPYTMGNSISFDGSGDLDNGMTVAYHWAMNNGAMTSESVALGLGDGGTLTFGTGFSGGTRLYDSMIPTAKEEAWDDLSGEANNHSAIGTANAFTYAGSFAGLDVTGHYQKNSSGAASSNDASIGASYTFNDLTVGYAVGEDGNTQDETAVYAKYVIGGATLAWSQFGVDVTSSTNDREVTQYGASFAVNENMSVSYGKSVVDFDNSTTDQEATGASISYTMGSITVAAAANDETGTGGTAGSEDSMVEVTASFAF